MSDKNIKAGTMLAAFGCAAVSVAACGLIYAIAPGRYAAGAERPFTGRNFAHRGLHSGSPEIPENTMPAFLAAVKNGYGIELDVQLTKDKQVIVFHDADLKRVCGNSIDSRIGDLIYAQLKKIPLFGSAETAPLFEDVLKAIDGRVPLIVELKSASDYELLSKKTAALLDNYTGDYCIQSFDPRIVGWFRRHRPQIFRGQLVTYRADYKGISPLMATLLACGLLNFVSRPQFIDHNLAPKTITIKGAEKLGALRCCWTAHEEGHEKDNDFVIFEGYRPAAKY